MNEPYYTAMCKIQMPELIFSGKSLVGECVEQLSRNLESIKSIFEAADTVTEEQGQQVAYTVSSYLPVAEGTEGGLYFGITRLYPGLVGDEYFMTKGHFHKKLDTAEFYWGIEGEGVLILMDRTGNVWGERVFPGSLHYIPGGIAHRMANTGDSILSFGACWGSDAGHDYGSIESNGFGARLKKVNGKPQLVK